MVVLWVVGAVVELSSSLQQSRWRRGCLSSTRRTCEQNTSLPSAWNLLLQRPHELVGQWRFRKRKDTIGRIVISLHCTKHTTIGGRGMYRRWSSVNSLAVVGGWMMEAADTTVFG